MATKTEQLLDAADRLRRYYEDEQFTAEDEVNRVLLTFMEVALDHSPKAYLEAQQVLTAYISRYTPGKFLATLNNVIRWLEDDLAY